MKKNIIIKIWVLCILSYSLPTTAQNHQTKTASYHNYDTECIEDKLDGSFIFMAWGSASTKKKAIDQACRNAINEILFKGVNKSSCNIRPLIIEVQAKEKYKEYIARFFQKTYLDYINLEKSPKSKKKSRNKTTYGVKVRIDVEGIRNKLKTDNIIK